MRKAGARTLGQNETSSVVYGMPKVAKQIGAVEKEIDLKDAAREIIELVGAFKAASTSRLKKA